MLADLKGMFTPAYPLCTDITLYHLKSYALLFVFAIIGATPAVKIAAEKFSSTKIGAKVTAIAEPFFIVAVMVAVTAYLIDGAYNPFLYFRF